MGKQTVNKKEDVTIQVKREIYVKKSKRKVYLKLKVY